MSEYISKEKLNALLEKYKSGMRVELIQMDDPYTKMKPGDKGTVTGVDDIGSLLINWDCGSSLSVLYGIDFCRIINENADTPEQIKAHIENLKTLQDADKLMPCPRCGNLQMKLPSAHNALSRYANVYICDACGMDEALRDAFGKRPLLFDEWVAEEKK
jgi:predicted RNA-binding Zn-ribbon protein involved in translation (DUF1610 family)